MLKRTTFVSPADDMVEKLQEEVTLHDVDATALQQLVEYSYTGEILITEDNVQVCRWCHHIQTQLYRHIILPSTYLFSKLPIYTTFPNESIVCIFPCVPQG
jgi:hypothetical protein